MAPNLNLAPSETDHEPSPIHVVVADDRALVRRSLRLLLESEGRVKVVAEASDLAAVVRYVRGHAPHVLILDLSVSNGLGIESIRRLREETSGTEIVVLTADEDPVFAQAALDAGALGFVLKHQATEQLVAAVRSVATGARWVCPSVAARLESMTGSRRDDGLTLREIEVLRLVALGYTSAEVASSLHLSIRTVETHRRRLHRKLGVRTRAELVNYAIRHGLLIGA